MRPMILEYNGHEGCGGFHTICKLFVLDILITQAKRLSRMLRKIIFHILHQK